MTRFLSRVGGLAALATLLAATALPASAQMRTERVRFTRGASSATLRSEPRPGRPVRYLVGVAAGQSLVASASDVTDAATCMVRVYAPGRPIQNRYAAPDESGNRAGSSDWSGTLSRAGDYQVVLTNSGRSGTCGLTVSVD